MARSSKEKGKNAVGRPPKTKDEKRRRMLYPVAPDTAAIFRTAAKRLGKKGPGWLLDDLARALKPLLDTKDDRVDNA